MRKYIQTKWDELWPIINVLNEVCHGLHIDIEKEVGYKYEVILPLLDKIGSYEEKKYENTILIELNETELDIIEKCFPIVIEDLGEWEFPIRVGMPIEEALEIKNKIIESFKRA
jgi:hypothetical protein